MESDETQPRSSASPSFVRRPAAMRLVQAAASLCWIVYGVLLHAGPVIVANLIVTSLAGFSAWQMRQAPDAEVSLRSCGSRSSPPFARTPLGLAQLFALG